MCHCFEVANIVDSDNFQCIRVAIPDRLEDLPSDAPEAVDTYFDRHIASNE